MRWACLLVYLIYLFSRGATIRPTIFVIFMQIFWCYFNSPFLLLLLLCFGGVFFYLGGTHNYSLHSLRKQWKNFFLLQSQIQQLNCMSNTNNFFFNFFSIHNAELHTHRRTHTDAHTYTRARVNVRIYKNGYCIKCIVYCAACVAYAARARFCICAVCLLLLDVLYYTQYLLWFCHLPLKLITSACCFFLLLLLLLLLVVFFVFVFRFLLRLSWFV